MAMLTTPRASPSSRIRPLLTAHALGILAATLLSPPASAQNKVTAANFELANRFTAGTLMRLTPQTSVQPKWANARSVFWYSTPAATGSQYVLVDATTASRTVIVDDATLLDLAADQGVEPGATVTPVGISDGLTEFRFRIGNRPMRYEIATRELLPWEGDSAPALPLWASPSPDGRWIAYARDYSLYLADASGANERRLTEEGEPFFGYQRPPTFNFINEETHGGPEPKSASVFWSPDSRRFLTWRVDARAEPDLWVTNSVAGGRPTLVKYKSAFPGDKVRRWELALYDVERHAMLPIAAERWPEQTFEGFEWSPDGSVLYLVRQSPDRLMADLLAVDAETGAVRIVIEERPGAHTLTKPLLFLENGRSMLWWSRRSGFGHLYLYDRSGRLLRQVTAGRFNVARVVHVSEQPCVVYFLANGREEGRNLYFDHLYRIGCDGQGLRLLTPENAHHSVDLSPDGAFFVDNFSRPEHPVRSVLRNAMGEHIVDLERGTTDALEEAGWKPPLMFSEQAADGETDLWGVMWTPYDLDSTQHYPVVVYAYPGPQSEALPLTFMADPNSEHLAQYGFVVLAFGNRGGSQLRSVEYAEFGRGDMRDYALADKRHVVELLAERFPFIDLERVGIWGGSSGGYLAAAAILYYPDFFKVAVARAGLHDPPSFDRWWNDWFQGMQRSDPPEGDKPWRSQPAPSNLELADRLQGHLLLIHGESDVVVHPSQSARLADALMSAGKRFDYWVVPGGPHGWSRHWRYMQQMIWTYFVRHLMGDGRWSVDMLRQPPEN